MKESRVPEVVDPGLPADGQGTQAIDRPRGMRPYVCYVLSYRDPHYIRTESLLRALEACRGVRIVTAMNTHRGLRRYIETLMSLRRVKREVNPDAYIIGFRGHEIFWLVKRLVGRQPVILDALMSPYGALHDERKAGAVGRMLAPAVRALERRMLCRANVVLTDTRLHVDYYSKVFGLPADRCIAVPVGAVEECSVAGGGASSDRPGEFSVLFYGSFLRLHGVETIVESAALLKDLPIRFDFIGGRRDHARRLKRTCAKLGVTRFTHRHWLPFPSLIRDAIPRATICLGGPFGGTPQARRVVTGKTSQCLALGRATVIGKIDEDYGFVDRVNCLLVDQSDAAALAAALRWAYAHRELLGDMGAAGRRLYEERLSVRVIAEQLPRIFELAGMGLMKANP